MDNGRALRLAPPDGRSPRMVTGHFNLGEWPRLLQLHGPPASPCNAENRVEAFEFLGSGRSRPCGMMVPRRSDMADHSLYNVPGRMTLIPLEAAVDFTLGRQEAVGPARQQPLAKSADCGKGPPRDSGLTAPLSPVTAMGLRFSPDMHFAVSHGPCRRCPQQRTQRQARSSPKIKSSKV
jgi:hypothetical protein